MLFKSLHLDMVPYVWGCSSARWQDVSYGTLYPVFGWARTKNYTFILFLNDKKELSWRQMGYFDFYDDKGQVFLVSTKIKTVVPRIFPSEEKEYIDRIYSSPIELLESPWHETRKEFLES